jgi:hypothetical protein
MQTSLQPDVKEESRLAVFSDQFATLEQQKRTAQATLALVQEQRRQLARLQEEVNELKLFVEGLNRPS